MKLMTFIKFLNRSGANKKEGISYLVVGNRHAEGLPLHGVLGGLVEGSLSKADSSRGDRRPGLEKVNM